MKNFQKGFGLGGFLIIVGIMLALVIVGSGTYWYMRQHTIAQPSSATVSADYATGSVPLAVGFSIKPAVSPDSTIDFGDGSPVLQLKAFCIGVSCIIHHTYISVGTYTATLKDPSGTILSTTAITVTNSSPAALSVPGMSQYTDSSFGFSFWYPSSWKVTGNLMFGMCRNIRAER